jgi:hypothetical protein
MTDVRTYAYHCRGASKKSATAGTPPGKSRIFLRFGREKVESLPDSAGEKSNLSQVRAEKRSISARFVPEKEGHPPTVRLPDIAAGQPGLGQARRALALAMMSLRTLSDCSE